MKSPSITEKTSTDRLKQAIARRRHAQNVTHLFDHSVPTDVLFRGVLRSGRSGALSVSTRHGHTLSPFVVHLKEPLPSPEEILALEELRPIRLNLLVPESHLKRTQDISIAPEENDLTLRENELLGQLIEETAFSLSGRWSLPRFTMPKLQRAERPHAFVSAPVQPFSLDCFVPRALPENFISYFEFPEGEDEEAEIEEEDFLLDQIEPVEEAPHPRRTLKLPELFGGSRAWMRPLGAFVMISFVFVLPIHAMNVVSNLRDAKVSITESGYTALGQLEEGKSAVLVRDAEAASHSFARASDEFSSARDSIRGLGAGTALVLSALPATQKSYKSGTSLVKAGEALAVAGERISDGFIAMNNEIDPTPTSRLALLSTYAAAALPHLHEAEEALRRVKLSAIPEEQQESLEKLQASLPVLIGSLEEFVEFSDMAGTILGADGTKRYLLVFQNNTEIRPTGGFMGSFAELTVSGGEITKMNIPGGGTYDLQGSLSSYTIAPKPLQLLKARWEFQDANWFADFPSSSRQLLQFYYEAGGGTMDGVIAINATYVADLLALLGPIEMESYGRTIDAENFIFETQKIVELEYDVVENKPKAFIGDLAPKMLERATEMTEEDFLTIVDHVNTGLVERDIQLYFTQDALQRRVKELGWAGEVKWTKGDYLMVIDTNLGGGKTDGVIEQDVDLSVDIQPDGTIINTLSVTRTHHGIRGATFTGVNNVDYMRVYVPKGSQLIEANGFSIPDKSLFDVPIDGWTVDEDLLYQASTEKTDPETGTIMYEESGKTVFGNWVQTKPGTASVATFVYELPFTIDNLQGDKTLLEKVKDFVGIPETESYSLTIQKQSGIIDRTTNVQVNVPDTLQTVWTSHAGAEASFLNQTDGFLGLLLEGME